MKEFQCGSLVPGCDWHTRAEEEAEVMRRAVEHMRETHGETIIRETMIEAIRSRIQKVRDAAQAATSPNSDHASRQARRRDASDGSRPSVAARNSQARHISA